MKTMMIILTLAFLLTACGKQAEEGAAKAPAPPAPAPEQAMSQAPPAAESAPAPSEPETPAATTPAPEAAPPPPASAAAPAPAAVTAQKPAAAEAAKPAVKPAVVVLGKDEALALAQQSGCLACHKIEAKLVGPAWQDVSAKYKGDAGARARLVDKVKMGGQGNWTEVTGGMPMPPYSPRVSDENIEKLVTFILSL